MVLQLFRQLLINALEISGKKIDEVKMVVNGAGAAAIACTKLYIALGLKKENVLMCDSKGVINHKRENLTPEKIDFIAHTDIETLEDALKGADVFVGLSKGNVMTAEMLQSMAENPVVFALANPTPEIDYNLAVSVREDVIMATGRSDFPNQVNNVLGFPYIFRGALDVQASGINEEMKLAAVHAIADLAKEPVPEMVKLAYNVKNLNFGREYFIPKPFDNRLLTKVSIAVAKAARKWNCRQTNFRF
jgi:malate dehydrogenase (oxaloacetate-decarboxylating)(NADP+)